MHREGHAHAYNTYASPQGCSSTLESKVELIYGYYIYYLLIPTLILSHIYSVLYPIVALLITTIIEGEIVSIDKGLFLPYSLTLIYIIVIVLWIMVGIKSYNYYVWTMYLFPNSIDNDCGWNLSKGTEYGVHCHLLNTIQNEYDLRCRLIFFNHKRRQIVAQVVGFDVSGIVLSYLTHCKFELDKMLNSIDDDMVRYIN